MVAASFFSSASWAADAVCQFRAKGLDLNFGILDPSINVPVPAPVVATTTFANMAGDCTAPGTMTISIVGSSTRQLVSGANTIEYTITGLPISLPKPGNAPPGKPESGYTTWFAPNQIQGIIQWSAYANAPAGIYTDSITVSINP